MPRYRANIIDALDQRVHCHLVLVMTVILGARSAEAVAFVDHQNCAAMFASGLNDLAKRLCDQRSHLADHAAAANTVGELEENGISLFASATSLLAMHSAMAVLPVPTSP